MTWVLNDLEKDIFTEVANIGLSKAADALAVLSKERVLLNVPDIQLVPPDQLSALILKGKEKDSIVIKSDIVGEITGKTLLLFSDQHASRFINDSLSVIKDDNTDFQSMKKSFLLEISNIITGSILSQISNIFQLKIFGAVPEGPELDPVKAVKDLLKEFPAFQPLIFSIKTKFMNTGRHLELPLVIIFDTDTLLKLLRILRSKDVIHHNFLASE